MTENEPPTLRYETEKKDGREQPIWTHPETGDEAVGDELGEVDGDPDEYEMTWTCRACGESHLSSEWDDDELKDAGMTSIHLPCADDVDEEMAEKQEAAVAENLRAAEDDHIKDPQRY